MNMWFKYLVGPNSYFLWLLQQNMYLERLEINWKYWNMTNPYAKIKAHTTAL
jgi:hypothetical protein